MSKKIFLSLSLTALFLVSTTLPALADHGISTWGKMKYSKDSTHFDYVNPDAPQGGEIVLGGLGTFDSLNPYIVKGIPVTGMAEVIATLLAPSFDEINTAYAYVAKDVKVSDDGLRVTFTLHPEAKFNNGEKITPDDVIFSFNALRSEGLPIYTTYYADVEKAEAEGNDQVIFTLKSNKNRELPIILGQVPVLSKKYYTTVKFSETSLTPPPSSGPYEIIEVKPGHSITYRRVKNWWGANLPSQKGMHNFETMRTIYYRDMNALFEAFKSGQIHWRLENSAKLWNTGYTFDAVQSGKVKKDQITHAMSPGSQGLFFNTRREVFKNKNVRKALTLLYNFEWVNKNIFFDTYKRNLTFFPNSNFEARGDASPEETAVIKSLGADATQYDKAFTLPVYSDEKTGRIFAKDALNILKAEGWEIKNQKLLNQKGEQLSFEILTYDKSIERIVSQFVESLKAIGVNAKIRFVDVAAYQERMDAADFDMIFGILPVSNSPGNELRNYYTSVSMNQRGTYNQWGIHDPAVDQLVEKIITAKDFDELTLYMRVLDRLLINNYYMIPAWHSDKVNVAYWSSLAHPKESPKYNPIALSTWWHTQGEKAAAQEQPPSTKSEERTGPSWLQRVWDWLMSFTGSRKN